MRSPRPRTLTVAALGGALAIVFSGCAVTPEDLYAEVVSAYSSAESLEAVGTLTLSSPDEPQGGVPGGMNDEMKFEVSLAAQRPNNLSIVTDMGALGGEQIRVANSEGYFLPMPVMGENIILKTPAPESFAALDAVQRGDFPPVMILMDFFAGDAPELAAEALALDPETVDVNGTACHVLRFEAPDSMGQPTAQALFVGKRDKRIHRIQATAEVMTGMSVDCTWDLTTFSLGGAIPAERFAYEPPEGAKIYEGQDLMAAQMKLAQEMMEEMPELGGDEAEGATPPAEAGPSPEELVGQAAPAMDIQTLDEGTAVTLADFKGKPTVVDFWATWCGPCIMYIPTLEELHAEYGDRVNFAMISDEDKETVAPFVEKEAMTIPQYLDPSGGAAMSAYGVTGIPTTFILDAEGKVAYAHVGVGQKEAMTPVLDELLGGQG